MPGDVVRVHNVGDRNFKSRFDGQTWEIAAGKIAIVPEEAAQHWTGRWYLTDRDERHKERTDEHQRLMVFYGIFDDEHMKSAEKIPLQVPSLEVYDLNDERIWTVLDDPDGQRLTPVDTTQREKDLVDEQIAALKRQLANLTNAMAAEQTNPEGTYEPSVDDVPDDVPTKVPVTDGPRRGRTHATS